MSVFSSARRATRGWARRHSYSFFSSLGAMLQHRVGTLLTVTVLGIAILLPLGLYVTLENLGRFDLARSDWGTMTVFFRPGTDEAEVRRVSELVAARDDVRSVVAVSPQQGLADFREASGFGPALEALDENPLPWALTVTPELAAGTGDDIGAALLAELKAQPAVELAQQDQKWLQRLARLLELGRALATVLAGLFAVAVVVVVANTIRLDVATRAAEIEVLALVGAGNGFIRQPFLYAGFWYGLLGGAFALLLLQACLAYLGGPLGRLLDAYGTGFELAGPGVVPALGLLLASGLLGLVGAWLSVGRHLRQLRIGGSLGRR